MKINRAKGILCTLFLGIYCLPVLADINMGIFPRRPAASTHKAFKPLAKKLSQALDEEVNLIITKDFKTFWKGVEKKEYDLTHFNQYHYLKSHKEFGYTVIAVNEEFSSTRIAGALSVRTDSQIQSVIDLKGKTILFGGGKMAMGSYIAPLALLKQSGLTPNRDFTVKFAKNPPSAVIGVYNKAAAASGSGNVILKINAVTKKIDASQMKILAESKAFIQLPWAVNESLSPEKVKRIQTIMTTLRNSSEGRAILKSARVSGFYPASDADFSEVREIVKFALGETL